MLRGRRAFTLIELIATIVVLAVLAVLAAIAIPRYVDYRDRAIATSCVHTFGVLRRAALSYYTDRRVWPPDNDGNPGNTNYAVAYWPENIWVKVSPLGGIWNWNSGNGSTPPGAADADVCIHALGTSPSATLTNRMTLIDQKLDDGVLTTGFMRFSTGWWSGTMRYWPPAP